MNNEKPQEPKLKDLGPGIDPKLNEAFKESEILGGAYLDKLEVGKKLEVQTQNRIYTIERREDGLYISGHPDYCPEPTKAIIPGSTFGGSAIRQGFIGRGMYMEFSVPGHINTRTSSIIDVKEVE